MKEVSAARGGQLANSSCAGQLAIRAHRDVLSGGPSRDRRNRPAVAVPWRNGYAHVAARQLAPVARLGSAEVGR